MTPDTVLPWLDMISGLATVIGIPVGILVFIYEKKKEYELKQVDVYFNANDRYMSFLDKIFENPELDCGEFTNREVSNDEYGFSVKQLTLYTQLIIILEQTWYVYHKSRLIKNDDYWKIWEQVYLFWAGREDFKEAWKIIDPNVESGFGQHMNNLIQNSNA